MTNSERLVMEAISTSTRNIKNIPTNKLHDFEGHPYKVDNNEEMQKLYQREGMSMGGGCLTSIVPMFIMLGVFYAVAYPLTNMMHLNAENIKDVVMFPLMKPLDQFDY